MKLEIREGSTLGYMFYVINLIYAFIHWGALWGLLNIFVPFSLLYDVAIYLVKLLN